MPELDQLIWNFDFVNTATSTWQRVLSEAEGKEEDKDIDVPSIQLGSNPPPPPTLPEWYIGQTADKECGDHLVVIAPLVTMPLVIALFCRWLTTNVEII